MSDIELWRYPTERAELVERLITAERARGLLERALREIAEQEGDRSLGAYVIALLSRNAILEQNVDRLTRDRKGRAA